MSESYEFIIPGRPPTKKNSRIRIKGGGTLPSKAFQAWYESASYELKRQFGRRPLLDGCYHLEVFTERRNWQHANDVDAPLTSVMDLLKDIVVVDDNPHFIRSARTEMLFDGRFPADRVIIRLTPYISTTYSIAESENPEILPE